MECVETLLDFYFGHLHNSWEQTTKDVVPRQPKIKCTLMFFICFAYHDNPPVSQLLKGLFFCMLLMLLQACFFVGQNQACCFINVLFQNLQDYPQDCLQRTQLSDFAILKESSSLKTTTRDWDYWQCLRHIWLRNTPTQHGRLVTVYYCVEIFSLYLGLAHAQSW